MSIQAAPLGVTFTNEAESAIEREVQRFERRLRARAIEESIRSRGFPAEVTGTDVARSSREIATRRKVRGGEYLPEAGTVDEVEEIEHRLAYQKLLHADEQDSPEVRNWRKSAIYKLLTAYGWTGVAVAAAGSMYPLLHGAVLSLAHNPIWRQAFLLSTAGVALAVAGFSMRSYYRRKYTRIRSPR
jgi:hypothetical protein